jgi:hypothetical protein
MLTAKGYQKCLSNTMRAKIWYPLIANVFVSFMGIQNNGRSKCALNRVVQTLSHPFGVDFNEVMNKLIQYKE